MSVIRVNKNDNYTVMSNYHLRDKNLSLKAKGLLSQILSLPDNWNYTIAGLVSINKENESAIKNALSELKSRGYLIVTKLMPNETATGRIEYVYDIYEQPYKKQEVEKQGVENLRLEKQEVENNGQLNTDKSSKDKSINEQLNKDIKNIVAFLNEKAGTHYRADTESTKRHIKARLNEGFTVVDFYTVITKKVNEWKGTAMEKYLRPETLFGTKFESYLNARVKQQQKVGANGVVIDDKATDVLDGIL